MPPDNAVLFSSLFFPISRSLSFAIMAHYFTCTSFDLGNGLLRRPALFSIARARKRCSFRAIPRPIARDEEPPPWKA